MLVENVMAELEVVAEEDAELNRQGKPAINKLKKLSLLTDVLAKLVIIPSSFWASSYAFISSFFSSKFSACRHAYKILVLIALMRIGCHAESNSSKSFLIMEF